MRAGPDERRKLALSNPGFILLAHEHFARVAELARYLALHGPVVVHVDIRASHAALSDLGPRVQVISTHACEWGMIGMVDATLDAARVLLDQHDVSHVCLLSGTCLPIQPVESLKLFLKDHPETDFIESVPTAEKDWVQGGLSAERFTLWYPFGWKRQRTAFDALVWVQRKLGMQRRIPDGLKPHLGLQWWCLTASTLRAILDHARLAEWRTYFAWNWIPDECFFQTLVRHVSQAQIHSQPLTLQRFDHRGRPFVFYDDHQDMLTQSGYFFARKIDPDADGLYDRFLRERSKPSQTVPQGPKIIDETPFETARNNGLDGRHGLLGPSKMTSGTSPSHVETVRPYSVIVSQDDALMRQVRAAHKGSDLRFHGRLFGVFPADLAQDFGHRDGLGLGCLPTDPVQRDYRVAQYLAKVLWVGRDRPAAFLFAPQDHRLIRGTVLSDPKARLIFLGDGAALLEELGAPLKNKRGRNMRPPVRRAWHRTISTEREDVVDQVLGVLASDWHDTAGWTTPPQGPVT